MIYYSISEIKDLGECSAEGVRREKRGEVLAAE